MVVVVVVSSHLTVLSTHRDQQYPQCPSSFFILDTNSVVTDSETEENPKSLKNQGRKSSASVPGTRAKRKTPPENNKSYKKKLLNEEKQRNSEMRQDTNDTKKK